MAALPEARSFPAAVQSLRGEEPLLIGLIGPPGGGKTVSALRLAHGMQSVRPGPVVLIDTEGGRSKKYSPEAGQKADPSRLVFDFLRVDMGQPFRSHDFLSVIRAQLALNPAAIIVDNMSEEHEGEGGFLAWHDAIAGAKKGEPGYVGGNEWAAWAMPKAARKLLLSGLLQIKVPLLFTFRAREKTASQSSGSRAVEADGSGFSGKGKANIVNIGWMPIAPLEIVHTLDLTCILPPKADGVPVWSSDKIGEDFIVKLPIFLKPLIAAGALSEATGAALAAWAKGTAAPQASKPPSGQPGAAAGQRKAQPPVEVEGGPTSADLLDLNELLLKHLGDDRTARGAAIREAFGTHGTAAVKLPRDQFLVGFAALKKTLEGLAAMRGALRGAPAAEPTVDEQLADLVEEHREREPGEDDDE